GKAAATAHASARSTPRRANATATARYIAPVSRKSNPNCSARCRAAVLLPEPAGPSIVTIMLEGIVRRAGKEQGQRESGILGDIPETSCDASRGVYDFNQLAWIATGRGGCAARQRVRTPRPSTGAQRRAATRKR